MYLPKNKYRIKKTFGNEFKDKEGTEYIGSYIELADGRVFAGDNLASPKGLLTRTKKVNLKVIPRPYNDYYGPTIFDYKNGFFIRYFIRDKRDGKIVEVNTRQFKEKRRLNYVQVGKLEWILQGPAENRVINDVPFIGAAERNRERVLELDKELKGLKNFIKNYGKFVR